MRDAVTRLRWLAVPILLVACTPDSEASSSPYIPVADVQQLMNTVLDPAAEVYWDAVGWILDFEGVHEFAPQSVEEWDAVRNAAYVLAEAGNLLMMDGRAVDQDGWIAWSKAMVEVGRQAIEAAEAEDEAGVFDAGAEVYYICSGCHASYALETVRPSDTANDSAGS